MREPYYSDDYATIYHGDCFGVMPSVGDHDVLLADPPYSSGGFQESGKVTGSVGTRADATIALDNLSTRGYMALDRETFRESPADEFFLFTDWKMWTYTLEAAELGGVKTRAMIVWDKMQMGMGLPWRNQHELIYFGKRTPGKINTGTHGNVIRCPRTGNIFHATEKPVDLIQTLLSNTETFGTVLDPFMGSGTTLVAAKNLGRKSIGIEIEERYCEIAAQRLSQGVLALEAAG